jgi:hypothetical protein
MRRCVVVFSLNHEYARMTVVAGIADPGGKLDAAFETGIVGARYSSVHYSDARGLAPG